MCNRINYQLECLIIYVCECRCFLEILIWSYRESWTFWSIIRFSPSVLWLSACDVLVWNAAPPPEGTCLPTRSLHTHTIPSHFHLLLVVQYGGEEFCKKFCCIRSRKRSPWEAVGIFSFVFASINAARAPPRFCYSLLIGLPSFILNYAVLGLPLVLKPLPVDFGLVFIKRRAHLLSHTHDFWARHHFKFWADRNRKLILKVLVTGNVIFFYRHNP